MAEGLNTAGIELGAVGIAAGIDHISLHTDTPDGTGSHLSSAGKVEVECTAASGVVTIPETDFTGGEASGAVAAVGYWGDGGDTWLGYNVPQEGSDMAFNAAGEYTVNESTITGSSS